MTRKFVAWVSSASFLACAMVAPAHAEMIPTADLVAVQQQQVDRATLQQWLDRDDIQAQLVDWGVDPAAAQERVASLTDAELQSLSQSMADQPAGAGALEVIGIVFVVLLILELVGVTNIFASF